MATASDINIAISLPFPQAGITVALNVEPSSNGTGTPRFNLAVTDSSGGRRIPFTVDACPPLADWGRGYSRWLRRARVTAVNDESGITGTFDEELTAEQVLQGVRDACDMVRQRFDLYEESILG